MLEGVKGPVVIELNISPGLQGITEATNINVADKIAKYLHDKAKERLDSKKGKQSKQIMDEVEMGNGHEIIMHLDFRGDKILLPDVATKMSKLDETHEVSIAIKNGEIKVKKFS
jgi:hypothetical protein